MPMAYQYYHSRTSHHKHVPRYNLWAGKELGRGGVRTRLDDGMLSNKVRQGCAVNASVSRSSSRTIVLEYLTLNMEFNFVLLAMLSNQDD